MLIFQDLEIAVQIKPLKTADYDQIINTFLTEIDSSREIILGHSFGGKVATLLNPQILILLSSAGIKVHKSLKVKFKIWIFKLLKVFGFSHLRKFFVANDAKELNEYMYQTFKNVVDEDFTSHFSNFQNRALICWGKDDSATPLSSGKKISKLIKDSKFVLYDGDHYFFMKYHEQISQEIEKFILEGI
jgi:non-heme chloroperoxidase